MLDFKAVTRLEEALVGPHGITVHVILCDASVASMHPLNVSASRRGSFNISSKTALKS